MILPSPARRSWALFILFLAVNTALAYAPLSFEAKLWTLLACILSCWAALYFTPKPGKQPPSRDPEPLAVPPWLWVVFTVLVLFLHFFRPGTFPSWPLADDGRLAYFSLDQARHWSGRMLWGESQIPPLAVWFFGFVYKWVPFDAVTFRMAPSLLSLAVVAVGYLGVRRRFSPLAVFSFAWFLGLGFWTLSFSRMLTIFSLYPVLEIWALSALFRVVRGKGGRVRRMAALEAGAAVGLAYDTALIGKALLAAAVLTLLVHFLFREKGGWRYPAFFVSVAVPLIAPVVLAEVRTGGMNYLLSQRSTGLNFNYLIALFWDGFNSAPYGPAWGGCFNPVTASLAFLGLAGLWDKERRSLGLWVMGAGFLFLLPGLLSIGTEMFRVLNLLPLIVGLSAFGLQRLIQGTPKAGRTAAAAALLLLSAGLDAFHYLGPYQKIPAVRKIWRNNAYASMYGVLQSYHRRGVRLGLMDFTVNDYDDHTFDVLTRSWNALAGPVSVWKTPEEVALVADVHYRPFLEKRFPRGRWFSFPENFMPGEPGWTLGILPAGEMGGGLLGRWAAAAQAFARVRSLHMYWQRYRPLDPILRDFLSRRALFQGDPFLESVFWEEAALFFNIERNLPFALDCYQRALRKGYPAAQLYNDLGTLEALRGSLALARGDFQKALAAPLNRTRAAENLRALGKR